MGALELSAATGAPLQQRILDAILPPHASVVQLLANGSLDCTCSELVTVAESEAPRLSMLLESLTDLSLLLGPAVLFLVTANSEQVFD